MNFPSNPKLAIFSGCAEAEKKFLDTVRNKNGFLTDNSGSCAIILITISNNINNIIYIN